MFKKIVIASAILATTSSLAFADGVPYVGADLGLNSNTFKFKNAARTANTNFNSNGLTGGLFAGYGETFSNNVYLGAEVFANTGSMSSSTKATDSVGTQDKLKMTYSYGVDFVPGYKVTEATMIYAKAGLVRSHYKLTQTVPAGSTLSSGSVSNTVTGGQLGLGVQTAVAKNVDVRAEFVHSAYNSFSAFGNKVYPKNNQLNLGLVYNFG